MPLAPRPSVRTRRTRHHAWIAACLLAALLCAPRPARALDDDVLPVSVFVNERYDSNLFSLPDDIDPPINGRRSAFTRQTGVGLRIVKTYGLQTFSVDASLTKLHYTPYSNLDTTSRSIGLSWAWMLTSALSGNLSVNDTKAPNSFADTGFQTNPNPRTTRDERFDVNYRPGASLHPRFGVSRTEDRSAQTTIERQNAETRSIESALVYEFRSANTTEVYFRTGRGHYIDANLDPASPPASEFHERESGLAAHWQTSGLSRLDGRVGYLDRRHAGFAERDFQGVVAQIDANYEVSGKTQVGLSASRILSSSQTTFSSYSRDETIVARAVWTPTGKITVTPSYAVTQRDFRGALSQSAPHLNFTTRDATLTTNWAVLRSLSISGSVLHSVRTSSEHAFQYTNRGASLGASVRF